MKRKISVITALFLSAALVSCGNDVSDKSADEVSEEVSVTEAVEEETAEAVEITEPESETKNENEKLTRGVNLSDADVNQVVKVGINGIFSDDTTVSDVYNKNVLHTGVVGLFGCPVEISSSEFEEAVIVFEYNPDDMKNVPPESLVMLHYNEEDCFYETVASKLNEEKHTVSAKIAKPGAYMLADAYEWYRTWGDDASEYAHDILYTDSDFNFSMLVPQEIQLQYVSSPLEDDEEGKCQTLLECYSNDNIQIGIEYLERPAYASAEEFITKIADILECERGTITAQDGAVGYYFYINGEDIGAQNLSMNCVFPIDDTHYINIWYGFTDEKYYETAVKSLESFKWNDISEVELPTQAVTEDPVANLKKSVIASDISFQLPDGITAKEVDEEWYNNKISDNDATYQTNLYEFDLSGYSDYLFLVSAELLSNSLNIHTEANAMEKLSSDTNGLSFVKRDSVTMSNGCEGEILSISIDSASEGYEYPAENGVYYIYGWFEAPDSSQRVNFTVILNKDAPQEIFDELYSFVMSIDMK